MERIQPQAPEIPLDFYCPIYKEVMLHPVVAADGFSYEERAWQNYENSTFLRLCSPRTGLPMPRGRTLPNLTLRALISDCPAAQPILEELRRELDVTHPVVFDRRAPLRNAWACGKAAAWSVAGALPGSVAGMFIGWLAGEWFVPSFDPDMWYAGTMHLDADLGREMARVGGRLGAAFGMAHGLRVGLELDTAEQALLRSSAQVAGVVLGGFLGAVSGAIAGACGPPSVCFILDTCKDDTMDYDGMSRRAQLMGCVGAVLGIVWGIQLAKQTMASPARRRRQ